MSGWNLRHEGRESNSLTGAFGILILLAVLLSGCAPPPCPPARVSAEQLTVDVDLATRSIRIKDGVPTHGGWVVCDGQHACFPFESLRQASAAMGATR